MKSGGPVWKGWVETCQEPNHKWKNLDLFSEGRSSLKGKSHNWTVALKSLICVQLMMEKCKQDEKNTAVKAKKKEGYSNVEGLDSLS